MNVKTFFSRNAYSILAWVISLGLFFIAFYIGLQIFQQTINYRVSALETQMTDVKGSLRGINDIAIQMSAVNVKLSEIKDRQDRQSEAIKDLRDSLR